MESRTFPSPELDPETVAVIGSRTVLQNHSSLTTCSLCLAFPKKIGSLPPPKVMCHPGRAPNYQGYLCTVCAMGEWLDYKAYETFYGEP